MRHFNKIGFFLLIFMVAGLGPIIGGVLAEEGFWLFSALPTEKIEKAFGVAPSNEDFIRWRQAAVRLDLGGSGAFVSENGLVMTNYHCVFGALSQLDSPDTPYLTDGFYAASPEAELRCGGLELAVMTDFEDVTDRFCLIGDENLTPEKRRLLIRERIEQFEKTESESTGLDCHVETFFEGGRRILCRYRRFQDVRLVFAPEKTVGFFGGDDDNFEYPRYNFDVAFLRVYDHGKPYHPDAFFRWSRDSAPEGTPVFVVGNPGRSNRMKTAAHLEFLRTVYWPDSVTQLRRRESLARKMAALGESQRKAAEREIFYLQNGIKARTGRLAALDDPRVMAKIHKAEENVRRTMEEALARVTGSAETTETNLFPQKDLGQNVDPWRDIETALDDWRDNLIPYRLFALENPSDSVLYRMAQRIVRFTEESKKTELDRPSGYRDSELEKRRAEILVDLNMDEGAEFLRLTDLFDVWREEFRQSGSREGMKWTTTLRLNEIFQSTRLRETEFRRRLLDEGAEAVQNSDDPLIGLALWIERNFAAPARDRQRQIDRRLADAYEILTPVRYRVFGDAIYPEANFTLRLSYGRIAAYYDSNGQKIPAKTTMNQAFTHAERHGSTGDYALSPKWFARRAELDLSTPMNLISTNDILGGNSGSPLVNVRGEIVGLVFDGNNAGLALDFLFTDDQARSVAVDSAAIIEALAKIYQADPLLSEIRQGEGEKE